MDFLFLDNSLANTIADAFLWATKFKVKFICLHLFTVIIKRFYFRSCWHLSFNLLIKQLGTCQKISRGVDRSGEEVGHRFCECLERVVRFSETSEVWVNLFLNRNIYRHLLTFKVLQRWRYEIYLFFNLVNDTTTFIGRRNACKICRCRLPVFKFSLP